MIAWFDFYYKRIIQPCVLIGQREGDFFENSLVKNPKIKQYEVFGHFFAKEGIA